MKHSLTFSPQFYITGNQPCPYKEGFIEKKLFTTLDGSKAQSLNDSLSQQGFRRSQNIIYRPNCQKCDSCRSVRIPVKKYQFSKSDRRILRKNNELIRYECAPWATEDQFELFSKYLRNRHYGGGMSEMDNYEFSSMIEESNVSTTVYEYYQANKLIAASLTDTISDGLSMVYSFYDVSMSKSSLGKFMILDHIELVREAGLQNLYLGYLVKESRKMKYKRHFSPLEQYYKGNWIPYTDKIESENDDLSSLPDNNPISLP